MPKNKIKRSIANVRASLAVEGLNMNRRSIAYGSKYLKGKISSEDTIKNITQYILAKQLGR